MERSHQSTDVRHYYVGIDVGTHSVGLAAVEISPSGEPISILNAVSHVHDSGVLEPKTATTRLAAAGEARRARRLVRRRRKRLAALDTAFRDWGWPEPDPTRDPYAPWRYRARLASEHVGDEGERQKMLVVALRHMARHRGWRNPYLGTSSLYTPAPPSDQFLGLRDRVAEKTGRSFPAEVTVAELAVAAIDHDKNTPLRPGTTPRQNERHFSYLGGKLMQSDNANEIHAYAEVQGFDEGLTRRLIDLVFAAEDPRGSWLTKVGPDPLAPGFPRASKATETFQLFRIASVLANVRVDTDGVRRPLSVDERQSAFEYLRSRSAKDEPSWADLSRHLGIARSALTGAAALDDEGAERLPARPPVNLTDRAIRELGRRHGALVDWWRDADQTTRDALVDRIVDGKRDEGSPEGCDAQQLVETLPEDTLARLDSVDLPAGRASYSLPTLRALLDRMLTTTDDLHAARKTVFGVDDSWVPPSDPINHPIGHPTVDRVTKIVARWLQAVESRWGPPTRINIEHVRDAFSSEESLRAREREAQRRFAENERMRLAIKSSDTDGTRVRMADVRRFEAITRQKGQCAYCGTTITYRSSEMDHIVPRRGVGSTNTRTNLVAVCVPCNRSKGNLPFATWAESHPNPEISVAKALERVRTWTRDKGLGPRSWRRFVSEVRDRLSRTDSDPEIDGRSLESVAWMATELRARITAHYRAHNTSVRVYPGAVTAGARQAAGIADLIPLIGGSGKTRFDRRHHAVDAAVVAILDESVARTLAERNNLRQASGFDSSAATDWREYTGRSEGARKRFEAWKQNMHRLAFLLAVAIREDRIAVTRNLRLRLGSGRIHEDKIHPIRRIPVGSAMTRKVVDAASTPALWTALTRDPQFDPANGLPENPQRTLRLHGRLLGPDDLVEFFDKPRAALAVRGGWASLGSTVHHARIYRWEERGHVQFGMLRVFAADLHRHRDEDLFSVIPSPSWISVRIAHPAVRSVALREEHYIGWLVKGDEVRIRPDGPDSGAIGVFQRAFDEPVTVWRVAGFESNSIINLRPAVLAVEGLPGYLERNALDPSGKEAKALSQSWRARVNALFGGHAPVVVRRDVLGRVRRTSGAGLPTTWRVRE